MSDYNRENCGKIAAVLQHFADGGRVQGWNGRTNRWYLTDDPIRVLRDYHGVHSVPIRKKQEGGFQGRVPGGE